MIFFFLYCQPSSPSRQKRVSLILNAMSWEIFWWVPGWLLFCLLNKERLFGSEFPVLLPCEMKIMSKTETLLAKNYSLCIGNSLQNTDFNIFLLIFFLLCFFFIMEWYIGIFSCEFFTQTIKFVLESGGKRLVPSGWHRHWHSNAQSTHPPRCCPADERKHPMTSVLLPEAGLTHVL